MPTFAVWPCNWDTLQLFLRCQSQWEKHPVIAVGNQLIGGGLQRLNYEGVQIVLAARCPMRKRKREFIRLQAMEFAVLEATHE